MRFALVLILSLLYPTLAMARVELDMQPSVGPVGGKSFDQFSKNAHEALVKNLKELGDPVNQAGAFTVVSRIIQGQLIASNYPSWKGVNQPPAPFSNERGNRLYFPVHILGKGQKVRLANLSIQITSGDSMEVFNYEGSFSASAYNKHRVGIDYGPDGKRDTSDDVIYNNNQPGGIAVDEIIYTGLGIAVHANDARVAVNKRENELTKLMTSLMGAHTSYELTATYTLMDDDETTILATDSRTVKVYPQPEHVQIGPIPESPWPLFVGAGAGLGLILLVAGTRQMIRRHRHRMLSITPLPDEEPV
jgi:hypothetical protein